VGVIAFILRAIFILFVVRLGGIVLRTFFGGLAQGLRGPERKGPSANQGPFARTASQQHAGHIEELVKDPVCGVHTARSSAIAGRFNGGPAFFCSTECAAKAGA
jgi:hypothetical protein